MAIPLGLTFLLGLEVIVTPFFTIPVPNSIFLCYFYSFFLFFITKFLSLEASIKTSRMKSFIVFRIRENRASKSQNRPSKFSIVHNTIWSLSAKIGPWKMSNLQLQMQPKIRPQFRQFGPRFYTPPELQFWVILQQYWMNIWYYSHLCGCHVSSIVSPIMFNDSIIA